MNPRIHAEKICQVGRRELAFWEEELRMAGIHFSTPELVILNKETDLFTAEFLVYFFRDNQIVDVFEFFIYKDRALIVSAEELKTWIHDNVPGVIARLAT